jgi:hypothetical protein
VAYLAVLVAVEITILGLLALEFQVKETLVVIAWRRLQLIIALAVAEVLELLACQQIKL